MNIKGIFFCVFFFSLLTLAQNVWQEVHQPTVNPYSLAVSSNGYVYAVFDTSLIRSTDNGQSWENVCFAYASGGAFGTSPTGVLYLCQDSLRKSTDEGNTWIALNSPDDPYRVLFEPNPIVANSAGDIFIQFDNHPNKDTYRSTDEGNSWVEIGIDSAIFSDIVFIENLCFASFWKTGVGGFLYKSANNGDDWEIVSTAPIEFYTLFTAKNGILYGGTPWGGIPAGHLYKSSDNGVNWERISEFDSMGVIDIEENQFGHLFVAAGSGVYRSTDDGDSWHHYNSGLLHIPTDKLVVDSLGFVYAGTGLPQMLYGTIQSTIPVEMISFSAKQIDNSVHLKWETATELNNLGFEIERKSEKSEWRTIGFQEGIGTTTEKQFYSFIDDNVSNGKHVYRLKQIDYDGTYEYSKTIEVDVLFVNDFLLHQNYPNPFNPNTQINYSIKEDGLVILKVFDVLGSEIQTLVNKEKTTGSYEVDFDASNLPAGIYIYRLQAGSFVKAKKMLLLK